MPGPHPLPPGDLEARALPVVVLEDTWWRISHNKYGPTLHFGVSGDCRFDAPDGSFGVCYLACDLHGAFIEVFGRSLGRNFVTERALSQRLAKSEMNQYTLTQKTIDWRIAAHRRRGPSVCGTRNHSARLDSKLAGTYFGS
jgi:hypothetical protein